MRTRGAAALAVADRDGALGAAAEVEAAGGRTEVRRLDLSDASEGAGVMDDLVDSLGRVDVLVSNAGTGRPAPFLETSLDDWRHVPEVNRTGAFGASLVVDGGPLLMPAVANQRLS